jgi:N-acetylneuraminate synthase
MSKYLNTIKVDNVIIGDDFPTYFIADIAANHDGSIDRAIKLIKLAKECGANAVKFQHFDAKTIVSDYGFKNLGCKASHQEKWKKSVYEVYEDASIPSKWTEILKDACDDNKITFFTSPYSIELVDGVDDYVSAYKVGSGDITWIDIIKHMASKKKPIFIATGASNFGDVCNAMDTAMDKNKDVVLMQCNTNYTAKKENFKYINLNVLKSYRSMYPGIVLGLSDHTPGHTTVLGAVSLGAKVIEKHFTDDNSRVGPDHAFSMNPESWMDMVEKTRELEYALGCGVKKIEDNEKETVILQRRSIRAKKDLKLGSIINKEDIVVLRPCPSGAIDPSHTHNVIGKETTRNIKEGECLFWNSIK